MSEKSPISQSVYSEVWHKVRNTNSKHSSKGGHEELQAGSWTNVRNQDSGILVKQEIINRMCVQRLEGENSLKLQSRGGNVWSSSRMLQLLTRLVIGVIFACPASPMILPLDYQR